MFIVLFFFLITKISTNSCGIIERKLIIFTESVFRKERGPRPFRTLPMEMVH